MHSEVLCNGSRSVSYPSLSVMGMGPVPQDSKVSLDVKSQESDGAMIDTCSLVAAAEKVYLDSWEARLILVRQSVE